MQIYPPSVPTPQGKLLLLEFFFQQKGLEAREQLILYPTKTVRPSKEGLPDIPDFTGCVYRMPVDAMTHPVSPGVQLETREMTVKDQGDTVNLTLCGAGFMST